tara:strand:+ start:384 stop:620 length:237 start_codon:yes stop_codon:yes gene_type:complete
MSKKTNPKELSPKEIEEQRERIFDFYTDQLPILEITCQVEEYKARISKARFENLENTLKLAQIKHELNQEQDESESSK